MIDDRLVLPSRAARGFENEPSDEWREDYGRGGPVRSNEPERDWFFEQNASRTSAKNDSASKQGIANPGAVASSPRSSPRDGTRYARESYRGRGPRGYRPSDERLQEIICERVTDHPRIDATDLEIDVRCGIVHLNGVVADPAMRHALVELVGGVHGVIGVVDRTTMGESRLS